MASKKDWKRRAKSAEKEVESLRRQLAVALRSGVTARQMAEHAPELASKLAEATVLLEDTTSDLLRHVPALREVLDTAGVDMEMEMAATRVAVGDVLHAAGFPELADRVAAGEMPPS